MSFLANLVAGSLSCIFCFIHLVDRDRTVLPRGKWLHFPLLALPLALAWQFVLEVRASASSVLEMVYLGWNDPYVSLPVPPLCEAIFKKFYFSCPFKEIFEWLHDIIPIFTDKKIEVQDCKTSYRASSRTKMSLALSEPGSWSWFYVTMYHRFN